MSKAPKRPIKEEFINTMHCSSMETWNTGDLNKKNYEWQQYNMAYQQIAPAFNNISNYPIFIPGQPNSSSSPRIKAPYNYGEYKKLRSDGSFTESSDKESPIPFEANPQIPKFDIWSPQHFYYLLEMQKVQLQKQGEAIRKLQVQNEILMRKFDKDYIPNSHANIELKPPSPALVTEEPRHEDQRYKSNDYDRNTWKSERGRDRDGNRNRFYGSNRGRSYNNNYSYNRRDNNYSRKYSTSPQNNYNSNQNTSASSNAGEEDWDAELADSNKSVATEQKKVQAKMIVKACQEASQSVEDSWDHIDICKPPPAPAPTRKQPTFSNKIIPQTNDEEENWDDIDITAQVDSGNSKTDTETKNNEEEEENWESEAKTLVDPKSDTKNNEEDNWETEDVAAATNSVTPKLEEIPSNGISETSDNNWNEEDLNMPSSDWNQMKNLPPLTEDQFVALLDEEIEVTAQDMKQDEEGTAKEVPEPDPTEQMELEQEDL